jgi:hypothetical protein
MRSDALPFNRTPGFKEIIGNAWHFQARVAIKVTTRVSSALSSIFFAAFAVEK